MNERQLSDLPGYKPLAAIEPIDQYLREKSIGYGDGNTTYAAFAAVAGGGIAIPPDEISQMALQGREQLRRQQGTAPYVATLVSRLAAISDKGSIPAAPTEQTALTTLFRDEYGVNLAPYMEQSTNMFGISGTVAGGNANVVGLNYMAIRAKHGNIFWQLTVDGDYGFVNMSCVSHDFDTMLLRGQGNITSIPGVEEALTADVAFIEKTARL